MCVRCRGFAIIAFYRYSLLWREWWPKEKFARALPPTHIGSNGSSV